MTREPAAPQLSSPILSSRFMSLLPRPRPRSCPRSPSPSPSPLSILAPLARPRPCPFLPPSLALALVRPRPHRLSLPSPPPHHINAPTLNANTPASMLLPILICAFSSTQERGLSPSPSLSLFSPGDTSELGTQTPFCITVRFLSLSFLTCCSPFYVCRLDLDFALEGCRALPPPSYVCARRHTSSDNSVKFPTFGRCLYHTQRSAACRRLASSSARLFFPPLPP